MPAPRKALDLCGATAAIFAPILFIGAPNAATADAAAEIRQALAQWTDDFNARRTDKVCDLFASDVRADARARRNAITPRSAICWCVR